MKQVIKSTKYNVSKNNDKQFILKCGCGGCGLLEFRKCNDGDVLIMFYSTNNLKKRDKSAWNIMLDEQQLKDLIQSLQEMLG